MSKVIQRESQKVNPLDDMKPWINPSEHIRVRTSLIKSYMNDPAACLFRYFKGLVVQPKGYSLMGTCTHLAAEHGNRYKLKTGKESKVSVLQDVFFESWSKRKKYASFAEDEDPKDMEREGVKKIVPIYHEKIYKVIEPAYVEEPFEIEVPELNATITGTMDLVETDHMIRDLKTKKRTPRWDEVIKSFQGKSYLAGYKTRFKKDPAGFMLDCIVRKKDPEVITTRPVKYKPFQHLEFLHTAKIVIRNIRLGIFFPKRDGNFFCNTKFCGYYDICHKGEWMKLPPFTKIYGGNDAISNEEHDDD